MRVSIDKLITGGRGLCRIDGKVCFIPFAIPGEVADVTITGEFRHYNEGRINEVFEKSENRVEPFCPLFGICGGCSLQHMKYSFQLEQKQILVREIFKRTAGFDPGTPEISGSPERGARNRVQLHGDSKLSGFRALKSDQIVSVESCPAIHPAINSFIKKESELLKRNDRTNVFGCDNGLWYSSRHSEACVPVRGRPFYFSPDGFFQSNLKVLEILIQNEIEPLSGQKAIDFYCGTGLFSSFLSDRYNQVTGIESAEGVKEFFKRNTNENCRIINKTVERISGKEQASLSGADLIVADPPRKGLSEKSRKLITSLKSPEILYISCDPVTLARDTKKIMNEGYFLKSLRLYDFYPHTGHMESAAMFVRK